MSRELPEPTAQGDLARTPFAHALLYCHQRGLSGTLVLWPEEPGPGQDRVRLERGVPVAARLISRPASLDRGLLPLFARRAGAYAFYADTDLVGEGELVRTGRIDPYVLIAASLRGAARDDVVDAVLAGFGASRMRVRPGSELKRFDLLPKEAAFLDVVRAEPAAIDELAPQCELGPKIGRRILYLLAITKMLEPYEAAIAAHVSTPGRAPGAATPAPADAHADLPLPDMSAPAKPSPSAASAPRSISPGPRPATELDRPPAPPPDLSREHVQLWEEIGAKIGAIDTQNYFEMLDLPRDAGSDAVRKAYYAQVKKWHPDRVPAELAALKPHVDRIFQHLTAASDTLCDEKRRGNYMRVLSDGGGTPESERKLAAIVQAAMDTQKAEVLLRRRDFEGALALLEGALELNAEDADALALHGWASFSAGGRDPARILRSIDRAIELSPQHDRAHFYRGMVLRKQGKEAEAVAAFERAAAHNPKNVDAVREVRLAKMRGTSSAATPGTASTSGTASKTTGAGGLLSKLFGGGAKKEK